MIMHKKRYLLALLAMLLPAGYAQAASIDGMMPYMGVSMGAFGISHTEPNFHQSNKVIGGYVEGGVDFNPFIGAELRVGATASGKRNYPGVPFLYANEVLLPGQPYSLALSIPTFVSYLLKLQYPITPAAYIYAVLGGTTAKFKESAYGAGAANNVSTTRTGFTYGGGFRYGFGGPVSVAAEFVQYWTRVKVSPDGLDKASFYGATINVIYGF